MPHTRNVNETLWNFQLILYPFWAFYKFSNFYSQHYFEPGTISPRAQYFAAEAKWKPLSAIRVVNGCCGISNVIERKLVQLTWLLWYCVLSLPLSAPVLSSLHPLCGHPSLFLSISLSIPFSRTFHVFVYRRIRTAESKASAVAAAVQRIIDSPTVIRLHKISAKNRDAKSHSHASLVHSSTPLPIH